jgi:subfamily B ATP-binding cassette protein MsbA
MKYQEPSWREKVNALRRVVNFRPWYALGLMLLSIFTAVLEGIGLSFILPVIEVAQSGPSVSDTGGMLGFFIDIYQFLGLPFTLGYLVGGVAIVMIIRYTLSFLTDWLKFAFRIRYARHLQESTLQTALDADIAFFDGVGSEEVLNAIVTQAENGAQVIQSIINTVEQTFLTLMYLGIALYVAPLLTVVTVVILGGITYLLRYVLASGYSFGDMVADSKERIQKSAQAGAQGIRDVKLFGLTEEIKSEFDDAITAYEQSYIDLRRNSAAITNVYNLITALSVFVLIYVALTFTSLGLGSMGVFLFAMFRLGPRVSTINQQVYNMEGQLPHLVRTQQFVGRLEENSEYDQAERPVPETVESVAFEDVVFQYETADDRALRGVSFDINEGEFVAFVGPSGAGKSTIASLLARMYEPDDGRITANGQPIDEFAIREWRSHISVVRQSPHIFNETLRWNLTVGNRDATQEDIEHACEIARVTEFLDELPDGYDTVLGDDGVRLSGGQRQRVAIARALLKDSDLFVLDEATSELDASLEEQVHTAIEEMDRDFAMLVIAHRLSTVTDADRIYSMHDGEIVEYGDHDTLLERGGEYAELYSLQEG